MENYRVVLADDHVLLRQGIRRIIEEVRDLEVIGEADDGLSLLDLLKRLTPDLVIVDISMPNLRGLEAIPEITVLHPHAKIIVLTMHKDKMYLSKAIAAGANGYLLKEDADGQLFAAIEKVRQGKVYVSPRLSEELAETWAQSCRGETSPTSGDDRLTLREREVLKLAAEGKSSKEIAELLCISYRTVEHHRASIMTKLNVKGTAELVKYAISAGYL
jgi:DNA-binding NarL/FixJ family response regulator